MLARFRTDLRKEAWLLLRDRRALVLAAFIPVLTILAYSFVEPEAEVRFDTEHFRTTDPTALVISLAVMFPAFMMGSTAIVRERTSGTLQRLGRTPMNAMEFVSAKLLLLLAVSLVQVLLVLLFAVTMLDNLTVQDMWGFILRLGLVAVTFVSLGLFVSALAQNEFQALVLVTFGVLVMLVLSGFLAPMEKLSEAEPVARMLPYTHAYLESYFFLKGLESDQPYLLYLLLDTGVALSGAALLVHGARRR